MEKLTWKKFAILWTLGFIGIIAVLPYSFFLQSEALVEVPLSLPALIALSLFQSGIFLAVVIFFGMKLSAKTGFKTPFIDQVINRQPLEKAGKLLKVGIVSGVIVATLILSLESLFKVFIPALDVIATPPLWQGLLASFYGAFTEELIVRYFLMSLLVWILFKIFKSNSLHLVYTAIISTALIFGLLHLPAMATMVDLTPLITLRTIALNAIGGIVFGYLYWKHGLEYAMTSHFVADILLQSISKIG